MLLAKASSPSDYERLKDDVLPIIKTTMSIALFLCPLVGVLSDFVGKKIPIFICMLLAAIGAIITPFSAHSSFLYFVCTMLLQVGIVAYLVPAVLSEWVQKQSQGLVLGVIFSIVAIVTLIESLIMDQTAYKTKELLSKSVGFSWNG